MTDRRALRDVARAADKAAFARVELRDAIRRARDDGHSLRVIAAAAGLSHEQIRRLAHEGSAGDG